MENKGNQWNGQSLFLTKEERKNFREPLIFCRFHDSDESQLKSYRRDPELRALYSTKSDEIDAHEKELGQLPSLIEKAVDLEAIEVKQKEDTN